MIDSCSLKSNSFSNFNPLPNETLYFHDPISSRQIYFYTLALFGGRLLPPRQTIFLCPVFLPLFDVYTGFGTLLRFTSL